MNRCPGRNSASRLAFPACLRSAPGLVAPMGVAVLRYSQGRGAGQAGLLQTLPCTPGCSPPRLAPGSRLLRRGDLPEAAAVRRGDDVRAVRAQLEIVHRRVRQGAEARPRGGAPLAGGRDEDADVRRDDELAALRL